MLESDWLTNVLRCAIIFREAHGERSSRHRITCPYYGAREGPSSVHLVLSWPRHIKSWERDNMSWPQDINSWECHIKSWERDIMSWPRDRFVEVTTSLC